MTKLNLINLLYKDIVGGSKKLMNCNEYCKDEKPFCFNTGSHQICRTQRMHVCYMVDTSYDINMNSIGHLTEAVFPNLY